MCRVMCFASSRERCALNKELFYSMRKAFLEYSGRASLRSLPQVFEKVSRPLQCHSNCFGGIYIIHIAIYKWTPTQSSVADPFPFIAQRRERVWPTAIELPVLAFTQGRVSVNWFEVSGQPMSL